MNGNWLQGEVYLDEKHGGPIEAYKKTTRLQDAITKGKLRAQKGDKGIYGYDNICRSWSQDQFKKARGVEMTPPERSPEPKVTITPSSTTTKASSTTGTSTSR